MNWKIGDRAMIINSNFPERNGMKVTVISELMTYNPNSGNRWSEPCHYIDIPAKEFPDQSASYPPYKLTPIPDDDHKRFHEALIAGKWSDCEWNPMVEIEQ